MRQPADAKRIQRLMEAFARAAGDSVRVYLVGGTTAVLLGLRDSTIDVDFVMRPEDDSLLRAIPRLKEELQVNVETASPLDFIPVPPGWEERSTFVADIGRAAFYHFDLYAQALAKVERGHRQDLEDVHDMITRGFIDPHHALDYFARIESDLYHYPAIHGPSFRAAVEEAFRDAPAE